MKQEELVAVFDTLKPLLKPYEKKGMKPKFDLDSKYDLWIFKDLFAFGKQRKEMYFVWLTIQSNYVGLYYLPLYAEPTIAKSIGKELLSTLKGKSCFHIKKVDDTILKQVKDALDAGYKLYKQYWRL